MALNQPLVEDLFKRIIGPFAAIPFAELMVEPDSSEDRVALLAKIFNRYPLLIPPFSNLVKSLNADAVDAVLEEKIRFYTTRATRNWLVVNLMNQVLDIKELRLDEASGRLPAKASDLIKFAIKSQNEFGEESRYKDQAYAGGLMFDFLFHLQRTSFVSLGQSRFDEPINAAFTVALEQAKLILKLSRHKPKLTLEKYALLTSYLRALSQVCMLLLKPNEAPEFYKKLLTLKVTENVRLALEMKTFGIHTGILATYLAQTIPSFAGLGEAMSVWGFPYLSWVHGKREIHDLSAMGLLGVSINMGAGLPVPELVHLDINLTPEVKREIKI